MFHCRKVLGSAPSREDNEKIVSLLGHKFIMSPQNIIKRVLKGIFNINDPPGRMLR